MFRAYLEKFGEALALGEKVDAEGEETFVKVRQRFARMNAASGTFSSLFLSGLELSDGKFMILKYEPSSEPLHVFCDVVVLKSSTPIPLFRAKSEHLI